MVSTGMRKFSIATTLAAMAIGTSAPAATIFLPMAIIGGNVPRGLIRSHDRIVEIYGLPDVVPIRDIRARGILSNHISAATSSDATMQADSDEGGSSFDGRWTPWAALISGLVLMGGALRRQGGPQSVIA